MKAIEKVQLLEKIGTELQSRMTFDEIYIFFTAHGIDYKSIEANTNSKRVYARDVLARQGEELLLKIADELDINHEFTSKANVQATFWKSGYFRLFLSHLSSFKVQTAHLQTALKKYAISSFVAHEDIEPSREWQNEIEAGLQTMDALAAILMEGFKESNWCDQEVGVAVGRDVLIIPIRKGLDPYGFIGKYQGIQAMNKTVGDVAELVFRTIVKSPKTRSKMLLALSNAISQSTDVAEATDKVAILKSVDSVPSDNLENLKIKVEENKLLMESNKFIAALNGMLEKFGVSKLSKDKQQKVDNWDNVPF